MTSFDKKESDGVRRALAESRTLLGPRRSQKPFTFTVTLGMIDQNLADEVVRLLVRRADIKEDPSRYSSAEDSELDEGVKKYSAELFGTGKSVRVDAVVDEVELTNVGAMVTGRGGHMISLNAK